MYKIYEIRTRDKKVYVGCTRQTMAMRMAKHKHLKMPFVRKSHSIKIVFETKSYNAAQEYEAYLIKKYDSTNRKKGYNRRFGGNKYSSPQYVRDAFSRTVKKAGTFLGPKNPMFGQKHTDATKEKIRQSALARDPSTFDNNRKKTKKQLQKMFDGRDKYFASGKHPMLGRTHSAEARKRISDANKGHKRWLGKRHSEATKLKISMAKRGLL